MLLSTRNIYFHYIYFVPQPRLPFACLFANREMYTVFVCITLSFSENRVLFLSSHSSWLCHVLSFMCDWYELNPAPLNSLNLAAGSLSALFLTFFATWPFYFLSISVLSLKAMSQKATICLCLTIGSLTSLALPARLNTVHSFLFCSHLCSPYYLITLTGMPGE